MIHVTNLGNLALPFAIVLDKSALELNMSASKMLQSVLKLDSRSLGLGTDSLSANRNLKLLLAEVHLSRERAVRLPFAACAWRSLLKHLVDLLERETLGLRY